MLFSEQGGSLRKQVINEPICLAPSWIQCLIHTKFQTLPGAMLTGQRKSKRKWSTHRGMKEGTLDLVLAAKCLLLVLPREVFLHGTSHGTFLPKHPHSSTEWQLVQTDYAASSGDDEQWEAPSLSTIWLFSRMNACPPDRKIETSNNWTESLKLVRGGWATFRVNVFLLFYRINSSRTTSLFSNKAVISPYWHLIISQWHDHRVFSVFLTITFSSNWLITITCLLCSD